MEPNGGLRPNGGVTAMTVMNPGRPRRNPFQWIEGRGVRHRHVSPSYSSTRGAANWRKRSGDAHRAAKLYAVDERGTVLSRPIDVERLASNTGSQEDMYNVEALRRAIRANSRGMQRNYGYDPEDDDDAVGEAMGSAYTETQRRAVKRLGSKPKPRKKTSSRKTSRKTSRKKTSRKVSVRQGRDGSVTVAVRGRKKASRKKASRKGTSRKSTARQRTTSRRAASRRTSRAAAKRTVRGAKRRTSRKPSRRTSRKSSKKSSRRGSKKTSRKTSRKRTSKKLAANLRRPHRTSRSIRHRASRRRASRRRTSRR